MVELRFVESLSYGTVRLGLKETPFNRVRKTVVHSSSERRFVAHID